MSSSKLVLSNIGHIKLEELFIMGVKGANLGCIIIYGWSRLKVIERSHSHSKKLHDFMF